MFSGHKKEREKREKYTYLFYSMNNIPTYQVCSSVDASLSKNLLKKFQLCISNRSRVNYIFFMKIPCLNKITDGPADKVGN